MGQTHKVTILYQERCALCDILLTGTAWKRRKSSKFYCEPCAKKVDAGAISTRKDPT